MTTHLSKADIRRRLMLIYHPVGTCRISDSADGAVVIGATVTHRSRWSAA